VQININSGGSCPISEQIRSQIAASIAALELRSGDLLTAPASLAEQLVTSPSAVLKAYRALETDGLCRRSERGFEVAPATLEQQRERARMQQLTGSRQTLLDELDLARKIQGRLMPPSLVEGDGYAVAARVHAVEFVSGDFFDVLPRGGGVVDIIVGDVSGKGVGASLIMAYVKAHLPMLSAALPVTEILRKLNEQLCVDLGRRQFVALACARFFADSGRLEIANAGLPDPHLLRSDGVAESVSVSGPSLPVGMRANVDYIAAEAQLGVDDRLLLYTDGIPEMPTSTGEPLGYEAVSELVAAHGRAGDGEHVALEDWLDGFLGRVAREADGLPADDQTALVLERRGL
jgi:serine phosphatase RsbU (regulator of sigma subunit)